MLISLMYHHAESDKYSNSVGMLEKHFKFISQKYQTVFPKNYTKNFFHYELCLVFDDAYFDFYYYIFPLLKKYNIKAILSVPTNYIVDDTNLSDEIRLAYKHDEAMINSNHKKFVPFCTWKEICEMISTGLVEVASHGVFHQNLLIVDKETCIMELSKSKKIIECKTGKEPTAFVYPYGKYNKDVLQLVNEYYLFNFSIGRFINLNIHNSVIYRVYADEMSTPSNLLSFKNRMKYTLFYFLLIIFPSIRGKI